MTRRDFVMIAEAFADALRMWADKPAPEVLIATAALKEAATFVADGLVQRNPYFDRARFMAACGFPA